MAYEASESSVSVETDYNSFNLSDYSGDPDSFSALGADCPKCGRRLPCNNRLYKVRKIQRWSLKDHLGCSVCNAILQAASDLYDLTGASTTLSFIVDPLKGWGIKVVDDDKDFRAHLLVSPDCPDEDLTKKLGVPHKIESDIAYRIGKWREWLHRCKSDHPQCRARNATYFPYRVLDLTRTETTGLVYLYERADVDSSIMKGDYACLSHCWGKSQPIKMIASNRLQWLHDGMAQQLLPSTFNDAIKVTKALGIKYLWIDSLCIMQDDRRDWETQAAEMANIYGSSVITFAATSAADCDDGIFQTLRQKPDYSSCQYGSEPEQKILAIASVPHVQWQFRSVLSSRDCLPLQRRAWAFQEYLLPPRVLSFGTSDAVWECQSLIDCECGEILVTADETLERGKNSHMSIKNWFSPSTVSPDKRRSFSELWNSLIYRYANLAITVESDRLVALQGIIDTLQERFPITPLYGHWDFRLEESLGWMADAECNAPAVWRAPTWSWLSLEYHEDNFDASPLINMDSSCWLSAECKAIEGLNSASTQELSSREVYPAGTLWMRAWTCPGILRPVDSDMRLDITHVDKSVCSYHRTSIHTDPFPKQDLEVKCVFLGRHFYDVYLLVCRQRSNSSSLERIGSACVVVEESVMQRPDTKLADYLTRETVAIW